MAKRFSKRVVRKIKKILKPDETRDVIEKEFMDSHGNNVKFIFDFNPHTINKPTIEWQRKYGDE